MAIIDKIGTMQRILVALQDKYDRLALSAKGVVGLGNSVDDTVKICYNALQTLRGLHVAPGDINPYQKALDDDAYFQDAWMGLALETEKNLNQALNMSDSYSVADWVTNIAVGAGANIKDWGGELADKLPDNTSLGFISIGLIALAVIFVMK